MPFRPALLSRAAAAFFLLLTSFLPARASTAKTCVSTTMKDFQNSCALHAELEDCKNDLEKCQSDKSAAVVTAMEAKIDENDHQMTYAFATSTPGSAWDDLVAEVGAEFGIPSNYEFQLEYKVPDFPYQTTFRVDSDKTLENAFALQREWGFRLVLEVNEADTKNPSVSPTPFPTFPPTVVPTEQPTAAPTDVPSKSPTPEPTTSTTCEDLTSCSARNELAQCRGGDGIYTITSAFSNKRIRVYCRFSTGGDQLIYQRDNYAFSPDQMTWSEPEETAATFSQNSKDWFIPKGATTWRWEVQLDGGAWQWIETDVPAEAYQQGRTGTAVNVVLQNVKTGGGMNYGGGTMYYQKSHSQYGCSSSRGSWYGLVRATQGGGDLYPNGIGGHCDNCSFGNGVNNDCGEGGGCWTAGRGNIEMYISDWKDAGGSNGKGGTTCTKLSNNNAIKYQFWSRGGDPLSG